MGRHLRLVVSNETQLNQRSLNYETFNNLVFKLKSMFVSKNDKIYQLNSVLEF